MKKKIVGILVCTLLIASISNIMVVIGQTPLDHDVGVISINSPVNGPAYEGIPLEVTVENFGTSNEHVTITMDIDKWDTTLLSPAWVDECTFTDSIDINAGASITFSFSDYWTPDALLDGITGCINYKITAFTLLDGDENPDNDCKTVEITLDYWHDVRVTSITTCQALGYRGIDVIVENRGTFPELDLTAYAEIRAPSGALVCIDIDGINLDEPLGGTKALDFDTFVFTEEGTYQIKICIPLAVDDMPGNNCLTVEVEIIDPGVLIGDLIAMIESMNLFPPGAAGDMTAKLDNAKRAFDRGDVAGAVVILDEFKGRVEFWKEHATCTLTDEQAAELKAAADEIIAILENCY